MNHLDIPGISAKWVIGFFGLFHISVAALAIGLGFIVVILEIAGYRGKNRRYDIFAKRTQLFHVCIYNIGTINAIGLVFALSGLFPQFWSQIFNHFFWPFIIEEFLFFLLATTLTFHYFFWEHLWGHKKLHIFLGGMMIPFFFLQMYIINSIGGFMQTPGFGEGEASLFKGILGYDVRALYNPSFLMLQLHRTFANIAYAGFIIAGWCGIRLFITDNNLKKDYYEDCGRISYYIAFASFLSLPIIGYFYSHVFMDSATQSFWNLMLGHGDITILGVDTWWVKQFFVAIMFGSSLIYFRSTDKSNDQFTIPAVLLYAIAAFYLMFYLAMGMIMTWAFFWWMLIAAVGGGLFASQTLRFSGGSGRALYIVVGVLSFLTVMLGGYVREASRPRFTDRIAAYDSIYVEEERAANLMIPGKSDASGTTETSEQQEQPARPAQLIVEKCATCHTLDLVRDYEGDDWEDVVERMMGYGLQLTDQEKSDIITHIQSGSAY